MATATPYKNPDEAAAALNAAASEDGSLSASDKAAVANAAALVPGAAAAPSPIQRTIDSGAEAADKYLATFRAPETADQIAERLRQGSQGSIDAINSVYDDKVRANQAIGQERLAQDNAISVLSGLTGSTEAGRTRGATLEKNDKEVQAINNERLMKTQAVYSQISQQALEEARAQREDATADANAIVARRKEAQARTLESLKAIAAGGLVDFDSFKSSPQNAQVYAHALDALGGSEQALRGLFAANRPQDQLVGTPTRVGDHFIQAYQNPTGKISYDKVEVPGGLPTEYNNFQKIGDSLVAIPDGWDGDTSKLKVIAGGSGGEPGDNPQLYGGLSSATATAVRARVNAFKSEPVVQNFAVIQEGRNFAGSLPNDTKNPVDDQALIYSLAKVLDPASVVREGEYATSQKYAQSWADSYGKGIMQAIAGTGFLTEKARRSIKDTIESRYQASKSSYDSLYGQYTGGINNLTGRANGAQFLTDYQTGGSQQAGGPTTRMIGPDNVEYDVPTENMQQFIEAGGRQAFNSVGGDTNQASNRPTRNNNPMNIKASSITSAYPGVTGTDPSAASDGGKFLTFATPQDGFNAAKRLITSSGYANLSVDQALKRWSNNGYGGELVPALKGRTINSLSAAELGSLLHAMARREGYQGALA